MSMCRISFKNKKINSVPQCGELNVNNCVYIRVFVTEDDVNRYLLPGKIETALILTVVSNQDE